MSVRAIGRSLLDAGELLRLRRLGVDVGRDCRFYGSPIVSRVPGSRIILGQRVVLASRSRRTALGVNHPVVLRTLSRGARLLVADDVGMSGGTICAAYSVEIGAGCLLGANVVIADTDFHPLEHPDRRYAAMPTAEHSDGVTLGRNVFVGTGSLVLKGVHVGDDVVIGAGSVVTTSVPVGCVVAGAPARVIRTRS